MARKSKKDKKTHLAALKRGVRKHLEHMGEFFLASERTSADAIVARLQLLLDDYQRTHDAYHAWLAALAVERRHEREARAFLRALDGLLTAALGGESPEAKAMGVGRRKTGPKTVAAKLQGAQKAAATRALRGTRPRRRRS
jgi:hypothetical protein